MRYNISVSEGVYQKLIELSSKESLRQKKRVSINDVLVRDYNSETEQSDDSSAV